MKIVLTDLPRFKNVNVIDNGKQIDFQEVMATYKKDVGWTNHIKIDGKWYEIIDDDGLTTIETTR